MLIWSYGKSLWNFWLPKKAAVHLSQVDPVRPWNYLWCCLWKGHLRPRCLLFERAGRAMAPLSCVPGHDSWVKNLFGLMNGWNDSRPCIPQGGRESTFRRTRKPLRFAKIILKWDLGPGTEFSRKLWGVKLCVRFDNVIMFIHPYYDVFVELTKWEANYGNDIFWGQGPSAPGYNHSAIAVAA